MDPNPEVLDGSSGGAAGTDGVGGAGGSSAGRGGVGGTTPQGDGSSGDALKGDSDATAYIDASDVHADVRVDGTDVRVDGAGDAPETGTSDDVTTSDAEDGGLRDATLDAPGDGDATSGDATSYDVTADADAPETGAGDVFDGGGPIAPQILPPHGLPLENPDAGGGPFESRCASDEVVTGFVGRAGVQTDALGATCTKLVGGVLGASRNLTLNGSTTGGSAYTVVCPANHVAVGIVGRYGHNTMWNEDVMTAIGVICRDLGSSATQTRTITGQPALDSGYTSFREDCTGGRYLTSFSGQIDSNSLARCVQQIGGECNAR